MKKQLVSILFALCMVLCLVPLAVFAEGETENVQEVTNQTDLFNAVEDTSVTTVKLAGDIDINRSLTVTRPDVTLDLNGQRKVVTSVGNGRLDAVANAIQSATGMDFHLETYSEHSLDEGSTSRAASYVGLEWGDGIVTWGAGTDTDIIVAGIHALVSAINNK